MILTERYEKCFSGCGALIDLIRFDESSSDIFGASCGCQLDLGQKLARIDVIYERSADNNDNKWE